MQKELLVVLSFLVITGTSLVVLLLDTGPTQSELDSAVGKAKQLYFEAKLAGMDFSSGPCLSNALMPGWIADIVHHPREDVDNLDQNMCPAYKEGRAKHFVELDIEGNLIQAR